MSSTKITFTPKQIISYFQISDPPVDINKFGPIKSIAEFHPFEYYDSDEIEVEKPRSSKKFPEIVLAELSQPSIEEVSSPTNKNGVQNMPFKPLNRTLSSDITENEISEIKPQFEVEQHVEEDGLPDSDNSIGATNESQHVENPDIPDQTKISANPNIPHSQFPFPNMFQQFPMGYMPMPFGNYYNGMAPMYYPNTQHPNQPQMMGSNFDPYYANHFVMQQQMQYMYSNQNPYFFSQFGPSNPQSNNSNTIHQDQNHKPNISNNPSSQAGLSENIELKNEKTDSPIPNQHNININVPRNHSTNEHSEIPHVEIPHSNNINHPRSAPSSANSSSSFQPKYKKSPPSPTHSTPHTGNKTTSKVVSFEDLLAEELKQQNLKSNINNKHQSLH